MAKREVGSSTTSTKGSATPAKTKEDKTIMKNEGLAWVEPDWWKNVVSDFYKK